MQNSPILQKKHFKQTNLKEGIFHEKIFTYLTFLHTDFNEPVSFAALRQRQFKTHGL